MPGVSGAADILFCGRKSVTSIGAVRVPGVSRAADILFCGRKSVTSIGAVRVPGVLRAAEGFFVEVFLPFLGRKLSDCFYIYCWKRTW